MTTAAWIVTACFAAMAAANWHARFWKMPKLEMITKPLATVLVIVLAHYVRSSHHDVRMFVVFGLGFCLVGDVLLMPQVNKFLGGLAAFLVGHVLFVAAAAQRVSSGHTLNGVIMAAALVVLAGLVGRKIIAGAAAKHRVMGPAVTAYLLVIAAMAIVVALTNLPIAIAGAVFFVISDTILGHNLFVRPAKHAGLAVMVTYHLALVGLTIGLLR